MSVLVIVLPMCCLLLWTAILRSRLESRLETLRAAGHPADHADLTAEPLQDSLNAAVLYEEAAQSIGEFPDGFSYDPEYLEPGDAEEAARWLESKAAIVERIHDAANRQGCVLDVDWSRGMLTEVHFLPQSQKIAWLLGLSAEKHLRDGDPNEAARCVDTMFRVAGHMPAKSFICYLARATLHSIALGILRKVAVAPRFDLATARTRFDAYIDVATDRDTAARALRCELVMLLTYSHRWIAGESPYSMMDEFPGDEDWRTDTFSGRVRDWLLGSFLVRPFALQDARLLIDEFDSAAIRLETALPLTTFSRDERGVDHGRRYHFSYILDAKAGWLGEIVLTLRAAAAVTRAGLDALNHKRTRGAYPGDLAGSPLDPYTGAPLIYRVRDDGSARIQAARPIGDSPRSDEVEIFWELP